MLSPPDQATRPAPWWGAVLRRLFLILACCSLIGGCGEDQEEQASSPAPEAPKVLEPPERTKIGLALSGGGYRATIHGLAALKALHQQKALDRVEIVSGVSGGSLAAAYYVYRRARDGEDFQFESFEADLLKAVANYEVPRSVVAAELQDATSGVTKAFSACVGDALKGLGSWEHGGDKGASDPVPAAVPAPAGETKKSTLGRFLQFGNKVKEGAKEVAHKAKDGLVAVKDRLDTSFDSVVNRCVDEAMIHVDTADLGLAIEAYAGERCPVNADAWLRDCMEGEQRRLDASVNNALVSLILLDKGVQGDIQRTYCHLKHQICRDPRNALIPRAPGAPPPHPLSELLHLALFQPWTTSQGAVHVGDLAATQPRLVVNATSTDQGDLWSATATGSGIRQRVREEVPPSWVPHQMGEGPRLSDAVAASACYPLFCRPVMMPGPQGSRDLLTDGGIFDNLGVLSLMKEGGGSAEHPNLVIVANAHRPYDPVDESTTRTGTVLRLIDMLMEQRSAETLETLETRMRQLADDQGHLVCEPVHVNLARAKETVRLGSLPTDLRPIDDQEARELLEESTALFVEQLEKHRCFHGIKGEPSGLPGSQSDP